MIRTFPLFVMKGKCTEIKSAETSSTSSTKKLQRNYTHIELYICFSHVSLLVSVYSRGKIMCPAVPLFDSACMCVICYANSGNMLELPFPLFF
jgi:hypothetical protein